MIYYRLRYGIGGLDKIITKATYESLSMGDKYFYELASSRNCGASHEKESERNMKEESDRAYELAYGEYENEEYDYSKFNLKNYVSQHFN